MNLEDLIKDSPAGVARFLERSLELGYKPIMPDEKNALKDAWTMVYGVGEETYMLVYAVNGNERKYPTQGTIKKIAGLKGKFDRKELLEQGRKNVSLEMAEGTMSPFVSEDFEINKLHIIVDKKSIEENKYAKFPAGKNGSYFAMKLNEVLDVLQSMYGKERVTEQYLLNKN